MLDKSDIDRLVAAYLDGNISKNDFIALKDWTSATEENRGYVRNIIETYYSCKVYAEKATFDEISAFQRLEKHIEGEERRLSFNWKTFAVGVAAAALILLIPFAFYNHHHQEQMKDVTVLRVPAGSQLDFVLPDGTKITLNSESELSYNRGFGISNRDIMLKGEGYFVVTHKADLPFRVGSQYVEITDLGTKFYFRDYEEESSLRVRMVDGKVSVHNNVLSSDDVLLLRGDILMMDKTSGRMTTSRADQAQMRQNDLNIINFDNMKLSQIAQILSRTYGVKVSAAPSAREKRFYGTFNRKTYTFRDVLDDLASTHQVHYKRVKGQYILY